MGCSGSSEAKPPEAPHNPALDGVDGKPIDDHVNGKIVMGRYQMHTGKDSVMGEGASSICMRGTDLDTGQEVAIKVYKGMKDMDKDKFDSTMQKFRRQIRVMRELAQPFEEPRDHHLWHPAMETVDPSQLFMRLIDFSKNHHGEPCVDREDGDLYVIVELAQYSLKDFLATRREQKKPTSGDELRKISRQIIMAMAGLHAKGYVHLDMKPENMMMFSGRLKVIDVDGCVRVGTKVSIHDTTISFSPCYCAPEFATFFTKDHQLTITASPTLDVWSVGMTLIELVALDTILKPQYENFLQNASSKKEASFLFMEWLATMRKPPLPKAIVKNHPELADLLLKCLLVAKSRERKSCAQVLSHPFIKAAPKANSVKPATSDSSPSLVTPMASSSSPASPGPRSAGRHGTPKPTVSPSKSGEAFSPGKNGQVSLVAKVDAPQKKTLVADARDTPSPLDRLAAGDSGLYFPRYDGQLVSPAWDRHEQLASWAAQGRGANAPSSTNEEQRLKQLMAELRPLIARGIRVDEVDAATQLFSQCMLKMDMSSTNVTIMSPFMEGRQRVCGVKEMKIYKGKEFTSKVPGLAHVSRECVGVELVGEPEPVCLHFNDASARNDFYAFMKVMQMTAESVGAKSARGR